MAKQYPADTIKLYETLKDKISKGSFSPFYLLMGEEPYFTDRLCELIIEKALMPEERDFNQTILYGSDTNASDVASACRRFPMMAPRQLIVVKEAQMIKKLDDFGNYFDHIVDTTILVLCFSGKSADKRTSFYKKALKAGEVFESQKIGEDAVPKWIEGYFASLGKSIEPKAALLLAEYAGNDLRKIALEAEKLIRAVEVDREKITVDDIEKNVGISREFNITELTNALAAKDARKAFKIAYYFGESPKRYPIQMTLGFLFFFFSKVELIHAHSMKMGSRPNMAEAAKRAGLFSSYAIPYIKAAQNFPLRKTMKIISSIRECDYKSKSNFGGDASDGDLLIELIGTILA